MKLWQARQHTPQLPQHLPLLLGIRIQLIVRLPNSNGSITPIRMHDILLHRQPPTIPTSLHIIIRNKRHRMMNPREHKLEVRRLVATMTAQRREIDIEPDVLGQVRLP